ncbi:MAG: cyclase family protein [Oscillospiraceae bacterium]|nr:cyclase family protein [Oscillospiraceae bacterium]
MLKNLSYPLDTGALRPPAIPAAGLEEFLSIANDGASVQKLSVYSHTGTHIDTSAHVFEHGVHITDFRPCELVFDKVGIISMTLPDNYVIEQSDLEKHRDIRDILDKNEFILFNFNLYDKRSNDPESYIYKSPGFSLEAGKYIAGYKNIKGMGTDSPSVASIYRIGETMKVHNELLGANNKKFIIIEEMKLEKNEKAPQKLTVAPWLVKGMHSGPCTVIGEYR